MAKKKKDNQQGVRISNRRARHDYNILEKIECGMQLTGTEVKSLRNGQAKIDEAYARLLNGELFLIGANIAIYPQAAPGMQHDPNRKRKLLIHKRQIEKIEAHVKQKGKTLVPLAVYFKNGWAKCEIGVAVGKQMHDKRQDIKAREHKRDMQREIRGRY